MKKIVCGIAAIFGIGLYSSSMLLTYELSEKLESLNNTIDETIGDLNYKVEEMKEDIEWLNIEIDMLHSSAEDIELKKKAEEKFLREKYRFLLDYDYSYADEFYQDIDNLRVLDNTCREVDINPYLVSGLIKVESDFDVSESSSRSSAIGLMQIIKSTGEFIWEDLLGRTDEYDHNASLDPTQNILLGTTYLKYLLESSASIDEALQKYNGKELGREYTERVFSAISAIDSQTLRSVNYI